MKNTEEDSTDRVVLSRVGQFAHDTVRFHRLGDSSKAEGMVDCRVGAMTNRVNSAADILLGAGWTVLAAVSSPRVRGGAGGRPPAFLDLATLGHIRMFDWCIHPQAAVARLLVWYARCVIDCGRQRLMDVAGEL